MAKINVEKILIAYLTANVGSGWQVFGDQPKTRPERYVLVDRTGGFRHQRVLDKAELLIEVYHQKSRADASDKAQDIADIISHLTTLEPITHAKVTSLIKLDDTIAQYHRYQIYCDIFGRRDIPGTAIEYPVIVDPDTGDKTYVYQFTNENIIVVNHNLGKYPSVRIEDSTGDDIECDIDYNGPNQLTITANGAFSGTVYLN